MLNETLARMPFLCVELDSRGAPNWPQARSRACDCISWRTPRAKFSYSRGGKLLPEQGYELMDAYGEIVGNADPEWVDARIYVASDSPAGSIEPARNVDWAEFSGRDLRGDEQKR